MAAPTQQQLEHAAAAHFALQPVARLLARDAPPEDVYAAVVERLGVMLAARITALVRFDPGDVATVVAEWTDGVPHVPAGTRYALSGDNVSTRVRATRRPARIDDYADAHGPLAGRLQDLGIRSVVGAPVVVADEVWGVLVVSSDRREPQPPETEERISTFSELIAVDIASAEARRELAASRARLVTAADEARRAFARDLHDGAQHRLAAVAVHLGLLERAVPEASRPLAAKARDEVAAALEELRDLAHGLHPTVLTHHGLAAAMASLAQQAPVPADLNARVERRLDPSREVAAYYVASEAIANAVKHARATRLAIRVEDDGATLTVEVHDDGIGGATRSGSGLRGLADRVEALGGSLHVASTPGAGTCVSAVLPV